jgi:hypothetical protein
MATIVAILSVTIFLSKGESIFHEIFNSVAAPAALALIFFDSKRGFRGILAISVAVLMSKNLLQFFIWAIRTEGEDGLAVPITILFFCVEVVVFILTIAIVRYLPWKVQKDK